jgi:hypothetical protein
MELLTNDLVDGGHVGSHGLSDRVLIGLRKGGRQDGTCKKSKLTGLYDGARVNSHAHQFLASLSLANMHTRKSFDRDAKSMYNLRFSRIGVRFLAPDGKKSPIIYS